MLTTDIFLTLWTMMCAIIAVGCAVITLKLSIDISKKKKNMMELRDEIVDHANITMELAKSMAVDLENMRPKIPHILSVKEMSDALDEIDDCGKDLDNEVNKE